MNMIKAGHNAGSDFGEGLESAGGVAEFLGFKKLGGALGLVGFLVGLVVGIGALINSEDPEEGTAAFLAFLIFFIPAIFLFFGSRSILGKIFAVLLMVIAISPLYYISVKSRVVSEPTKQPGQQSLPSHQSRPQPAAGAWEGGSTAGDGTAPAAPAQTSAQCRKIISEARAQAKATKSEWQWWLSPSEKARCLGVGDQRRCYRFNGRDYCD